MSRRRAATSSAEVPLRSDPRFVKFAGFFCGISTWDFSPYYLTDPELLTGVSGLTGLEYLDQYHREPLTCDRPLVRCAARHHDHVSLLDRHSLTARARLAAPFTRSSFVRLDQRPSEHEYRLALQHVIDVVGRVVHLEQVVLALLVVKDGHAHLNALRGDDVELLIAFLRFEVLDDVDDLPAGTHLEFTCGCRWRA